TALKSLADVEADRAAQRVDLVAAVARRNAAVAEGDAAIAVEQVLHVERELQVLRPSRIAQGGEDVARLHVHGEIVSCRWLEVEIALRRGAAQARAGGPVGVQAGAQSPLSHG